MRTNEYYNLIVASEPGHWDRKEGKTPKGRFHYCSQETIAARFPMSDAVEMTLKTFPALIVCEVNHQTPTPAYVGRITRVEHRTDSYYLHFELDPSIPQIPQKTLLELADALDIGTRGFGDLGSQHWSVKQVDLYSVLERHQLRSRQHDSTAHAAPADSRSRVFIVHGHDEAAKYAVQALLERLGLEGVILDEQTGRGDTIIAKFEREAGNAAFAVVLLTPDDKGGVATGGVNQLKPRARQNVIFELGYFAAKLGRGRVCALRRGDVEIPSDFSGVQYLPYDDGGAWRIALAKEMRDAGLPVDMNRL